MSSVLSGVDAFDAAIKRSREKREIEQAMLTSMITAMLNNATESDLNYGNIHDPELMASEVTEACVRALITYTDEAMLIEALGTAAGLQMK